jgi:hypothetical protein
LRWFFFFFKSFSLFSPSLFTFLFFFLLILFRVFGLRHQKTSTSLVRVCGLVALRLLLFFPYFFFLSFQF